MDRIKVSLLGSFAIEYNNKPIELPSNYSKNTMKLLQMLLFFGKEGVHRKWLWANLFSNEEVDNPANNLRVTVHALRKILKKSGLPDHEYILIQNNNYYFDAPCPLDVDIHRLYKLYNLLLSASDSKRSWMLAHLVMAYKGDFLPWFIGETWVDNENKRLHEVYFDIFDQCMIIYKQNKDFDSIISLCDKALSSYPREDWFLEKMDAQIAVERYKDAYRTYEEAVSRLYSEFGAPPSEALIRRFRSLTSKIKNISASLDSIKTKLSEGPEITGALFCNYPSFIDNYRMIQRVIRRTGMSIVLMLFTLVDEYNVPMDSSSKLITMSDAMERSLVKCLRIGDVVTKYSPNQFLVLLLDTTIANCDLVAERIRKDFTRGHRSWNKHIIFSEVSLDDVRK